MRKGFTMIELIFVIVILGVLASVAIPRLAATRDDAEVAKAATNLSTAVSDLAAYYTAQGDFKKAGTGTNAVRQTATLTDMTNALDDISGLKGYIKVKSVKCLSVEAKESTANASAMITINKDNAGNNENACKSLLKMNGVKNMCGVAINASAATMPCNITIGGTGVNF